MLAQNFKMAADLGISDVELDALIKVLGMLEREEIPFARSGLLDARPADYGQTPTHFNMILIKSATECGTAACICGWARHIAGDDDLFHHILPDSLAQLFMMQPAAPYSGAGMNNVRPHQAALALRSYITTGEANWAEALI